METFTSGWSTVGWVAASTAAIYLSTLIGVRVAGRRTVSQLSAFDFVVTVALGTLVASVALSPTTPYARGLGALLTLLVLQLAIAAGRRRWPRFARLVDFAPLPVVRDGRADLDNGLSGPQLTRADLEALLRQHGVQDVEQVALALLEPTGELSVTRRRED